MSGHLIGQNSGPPLWADVSAFCGSFPEERLLHRQRRELGDGATTEVRLLSGSAKFFHVVFEKPVDLAVHDQIGAPEIQELLPLGVAIAYHPGRSEERRV